MKQFLIQSRYVFVPLLASLMTLYAEWKIWASFFEDRLSLKAALFYHLFVVLALGGIVYLLRRSRHGLRFMIITLLFVSTMGAFGAGLSLLLLVLYAFYSGFTDPIQNLIKMLMPELKSTKTEELYDRIVFGMETYDLEVNPIPINEIMIFGSPSQKIAAIEKMLKHFNPDFVELLKMALVDKNNSVRVMAATAISSLEDHFHRQFVQHEREYKDEKRDPETILELAKICTQYAGATFFDEKRTSFMRKTAIEKYKEYLKLVPQAKDVPTALAMLLVEEGQHDEAEVLLFKLARKPETLTEEVYYLLMKIFFEKGEYDYMHRFTQDHVEELIALQKKTESRDLEEMIMLWGGEKGAWSLMEAASYA